MTEITEDNIQEEVVEAPKPKKTKATAADTGTVCIPQWQVSGGG